jgi:hypothetical protein
MTKYIVKVLKVQGINKITYKAGAEVTDANFPEGVALKLAVEGFIEEVKSEVKAEEVKAEAKTEEVKSKKSSKTAE